MDLKFCNASVDFNVPGKSNPPPVKLTATVWKQSRFLKSGELYKYAIEFTDPSGTLALPSMPLNTWVQVERNPDFEPYAAGYEYESCSGLQQAPILFKDQLDGDTKLVTVVENNVTLTPVDTSNERCAFFCCKI